MANVKGFSFDYEKSELASKLDKMYSKLKPALLMYSETKALQYTSYMKTNRPWTDRTGWAKQLLKTEVSEPSETTIRLTFSHGVDYGIWLELAHNKNYAIIEPTIRTHGTKYIEGIGMILEKLR